MIVTPDKDLGQCVKDRRVVQFDRRKRELIDEEAVIAKFGVAPGRSPTTSDLWVTPPTASRASRVGARSRRQWCLPGTAITRTSRTRPACGMSPACEALPNLSARSRSTWSWPSCSASSPRSTETLPSGGRRLAVEWPNRRVRRIAKELGTPAWLTKRAEWLCHAPDGITAVSTTLPGRFRSLTARPSGGHAIDQLIARVNGAGEEPARLGQG